MRSIRLAQFAAEAERLHLRYLLRRQTVRVALAGVAAIFLLAALVGAHVAGGMELAEHYSPVQAVMIVVGIDAVVAIVLGAIAARDVPSPAEREALLLRRIVVEEAVQSLAIVTLVNRVRRVRSTRDLLNVGLSSVAAWTLGTRT